MYLQRIERASAAIIRTLFAHMVESFALYAAAERPGLVFRRVRDAENRLVIDWAVAERG